MLLLDLGLISSAQAGDPAAIDRLLSVSQPDIRRYARRVCRATDIDDAVQDALWIVARRIASLRAAGAYWGWLIAVVKRECIKLTRRVTPGATDLDSLANDLRLASRPELELRLDLSAAIASLPEHYRIVLVLRDGQELTIDEIAARLEATRETVKARLHRARGLVREYLER